MKFLIFLFFFPITSFGEYRVYQYFIREKNSIDPPPYMDISTLDPIGYQAYHGGEKSLDLTLLRTWICRGNTAYSQTCGPPQKIQEKPRIIP